jgi:hypothetical protein
MELRQLKQIQLLRVKNAVIKINAIKRSVTKINVTKRNATRQNVINKPIQRIQEQWHVSQVHANQVLVVVENKLSECTRKKK